MLARSRVTFAGGIAFAVAVGFPATDSGATPLHDLYMTPALNVTSVIPSEEWQRLSPDIKLGADFADGSLPNLVRRGVDNQVYGRFLINGINDHTVGSNQAKIQFHYRTATPGETPPALDSPGAGWVHIGDLPVTYNEATDGYPLFITKHWPDDYPSVTTRSVTWTWNPATTGTHFHVRAEAVYPTGTVDEKPEDNVAVSLYESILGLRDVDLVILHDVSGSMLFYTHEGDSYIDHAKAHAIPFVLTMNSTDRLAVVAFGGCLSGDVADIWPSPTASLTPVASFANKLAAVSAIQTNVTVLNTGCATPLGVGLQRAVAVLTAETLDPDRKRAILLLSDGYENSGMPRACDGSDPSAPCVGTSLLAQLQANDIRVFTIALGSVAAIDCLECLADGTGGQWYSTPDPGLDLALVYKDMQQAYTEDDLYRVDRGVSGGGDDSYATYFDGLDNLLYFVLETDNLNAELDLQLQPPGGLWSDAAGLKGASVQRGRGYEVVRVTAPAAGTWGYRVTGEPRRDYLVSVRSDYASVRLRLKILPVKKVGEPIVIQARLERNGIPITDAQPIATVHVPFEASLDSRLRSLARDYLLKHQAPPPFGPVLAKEPDLSPRGALVQALGADRLQPTHAIRVALQHQGDGVYSGTLDRHTQLAGVYRVEVTAASDVFDRVQAQQLRLEPGDIDYRRSLAEIVRLKPDGEAPRWMLRVYPQDGFGNAIADAPLTGLVKVELTDGDLSGKPVLSADGSIEQSIVPAAGRTPVLRRIRIGDHDLILDPTPEPAARDYLPWLLLLLVVLAVVARYAWVRARS